jgi:hypothetical protein
VGVGSDVEVVSDVELDGVMGSGVVMGRMWRWGRMVEKWKLVNEVLCF